MTTKKNDYCLSLLSAWLAITPLASLFFKIVLTNRIHSLEGLQSQASSIWWVFQLDPQNLPKQFNALYKGCVY